MPPTGAKHICNFNNRPPDEKQTAKTKDQLARCDGKRHAAHLERQRRFQMREPEQREQKQQPGSNRHKKPQAPGQCTLVLRQPAGQNRDQNQIVAS